jgi:ATP-binding cassette subfamily F protein 3
VREQELRNFLGGFNFRGSMAERAVGSFSGGEKARLVLALLLHARPNLLLLDEPTNHLDLDMRHALTLAMQEFEGALVVVAHDRHLLRTTTDTFLLVNDGKVEPWTGDLDDYAAWLSSDRRATAASGSALREPVRGNERERRQQAAQRREQLRPLREAVKKTEQGIAKLEALRAKLEATLADPALYEASQREKLTSAMQDKARVERELAAAEESWLVASTALEEAEAEAAAA